MAAKGTSQNTSKESGGFMSYLRASYKAGMGAAEGMQQATMEVPLFMLEAIGVSKDQTNVLREKNKQLVHGMVGAIEGMAAKFVEAGTQQVGLAAEAIQESKSKKAKAKKAEATKES